MLLLLLFCLSSSRAERSGFFWADDLRFLGFSTGGFILASQEGTRVCVLICFPEGLGKTITWMSVPALLSLGLSLMQLAEL